MLKRDKLKLFRELPSFLLSDGGHCKCRVLVQFFLQKKGLFRIGQEAGRGRGLQRVHENVTFIPNPDRKSKKKTVLLISIKKLIKNCIKASNIEIC
jgi:hypothetical protein